MHQCRLALDTGAGAHHTVALEERIIEVVEYHRDLGLPMSVRQAFYVALASDGAAMAVVPKTLAGYRKVQQIVKTLRREERLRYEDIVDNSRSMLVHNTFDDITDWIEHYQQFFKVSPFRESDTFVQVWTESLGVSGTLDAVCDEYGLHCWPSRGYGSDTFIWRAANNIRTHIGDRSRVQIVYVGDYDKHGARIPQVLQEKIQGFLAEDEVIVNDLRIVAVTEDQIDGLSLPWAPPEMTKEGEFDRTVQAEAVPPAVLRDLLRAEIDLYLPPGALARAKMEGDKVRNELVRQQESISALVHK